MFIFLHVFFYTRPHFWDNFAKFLSVKVILSALKKLLVYSKDALKMFSAIHFNNLLGMKTKRANVNRKVRKLGNITWGISSDIPQFWLHQVTCLDQSRSRKIFDGL